MSYRSEIIRLKKMGRPPRFATAEDIWNEFVAYVDFVDKHKIDLPTHIVKGSHRDEGRGGQVARPLTLTGFMVFAGVGSKWQDFARHQCERGNEFSEVITRIRNIVSNDQIEGGVAGIYNSNLTARLNGLTEKQQVSGTMEQSIVIKTDADSAQLIKDVINAD